MPASLRRHRSTSTAKLQRLAQVHANGARMNSTITSKIMGTSHVPRRRPLSNITGPGSM